MKITFVFPHIAYHLATTPYPSLGIGYLAAAIRKACPFATSVDLIDGQMMEEEDFWKAVRSIDADAVLVSATIQQTACARRIASEVKRHCGCPTVLGGPGPSAIADEAFMLKSDFDIVGKGEGEEMVPVLLDRLQRGAELHDVPGLLFKHDGQVTSTPRAELPDVCTIPWPDREIFDGEAYLQRWRNEVATTSVHIMGSRGCPFRCAFCDRTVTGKTVRYREPEDIVAEMLYLEERYHPDDIFYFDDLFTLHKKRVVKLCSTIRSSNLATRWSAQGRVELVDEEMLQAMKDAGCDEVNFGVESGSDRILKQLVKGFKREHVIRAFDLCRQVGIKAGAYLIVGVPGETREDIEASRSLVERIQPSILNFSFLTPFPNTPLHTATRQWIGDWDYEQWDDFTNSVYDVKFEIDPRASHDMILGAYMKIPGAREFGGVWRIDG